MSEEDDRRAWEAEEERKRREAEQRQSREGVEPLAAPTPGTAIAANVTIDALFTSVFGTRSSDLAATPTYSWNTPNSIIAQWPGVANNYSCIVARFEARQQAPSTIVQ